MTTDGLRWSSWQSVVDSAYEKPAYKDQLARRVCVPIVTAIVVAVLLVVLRPPFACAPSSDATMSHATPSATRVVCWSVLAAIAVVVVVQSECFKFKT